MSKNYLKLLEESLPPPNHKMYDLWKHYALDAVKRGFVVKKIVSRFVDFSQGKILDIGCGEGGITIAFAKCETDVCSVDIDRKRVYRSKVRAHEEGCAYVNFVIADGLQLPFRDGAFDVVICNDLIEHIPKPNLLMKEAYRVLKACGIIYLSTPNKVSPLQIIRDGHYGLFALTLMPEKVARWYVTKLRKIAISYDVYTLFTYWSLKKLFKNFNLKCSECFEEYYISKDLNRWQSFLIKSGLLKPIVSRLIIPTFIFVCRKMEQ
jgi:2-polyprenyl-3-methyl-5-hydroxy-6-metoxy-1,4-benzoquinol methylase